jgi:hypothetical protein
MIEIVIATVATLLGCTASSCNKLDPGDQYLVRDASQGGKVVACFENDSSESQVIFATFVSRQTNAGGKISYSRVVRVSRSPDNVKPCESTGA